MANHNVGRELLDVPFPQMIYNMASAIAMSQAALDNECINILKKMGDKENYPISLPKVNLDSSGKLLDEDEDFVTSMIGAGFQPTFYQFSETIIEVKMTIKFTESYEEKGQKVVGYNTTTTKSKVLFFPKTTVCTTPINANYTNKNNYSVEGYSLLRTRLVPVPPNTFIQRLLDMKAQAMQAQFALELRKVELQIEKMQAAENEKIAEEERKPLT